MNEPDVPGLMRRVTHRQYLTWREVMRRRWKNADERRLEYVAGEQGYEKPELPADMSERVWKQRLGIE